MAKPKQNPVSFAPEKYKRKKKTQENVDPVMEDDWIVVKKQKVTIFIPPLTNRARLVMPNVVQEMPTKTNSQVVVLALEQSGHEPEKSLPLAPEQSVPPADNEVVHLVVPNSTSQEPMSLSHRVASGNSPLHSIGDRKVGVSDARNVNKRTIAFVGSGAILDRRMRASYLEKKLKRVGGLENWLLSLGLSYFTKVFQKQRVHKFHLANLTMKKLEDMGVYAVGPRRKLLHAIDCLCEPHCFQRV